MRIGKRFERDIILYRLYLPECATNGAFAITHAPGWRRSISPWEDLMPLMEWDTFCDTHHRPFIIHSQIQPKEAHSFEALQRFIKSLKLKGNFALSVAGSSIRVAFESEDEAFKAAGKLRAVMVGPGFEWAGEWTLDLNNVPEKIMPRRRLTKQRRDRAALHQAR